MTEKKFIKGLFITEFEGKYGDFLRRLLRVKKILCHSND